MSEILLVHGAAHGAWCWRDVIPALQSHGHTARAIDLPGHGDDPTPTGQVTLRAYADAIHAAMTGPSVLVGHSMAGYPITQVAEEAPRTVSRLIYLCAHLPSPGRTLTENRKQAARQPLLPAIRMAADRKSFTFDPDMAHEIFYHDCPDGTLDYALPRLCAQAVAPTEVPVETGPRYASVPRSYILCQHDGAIPPEFQAEMTRDWPRKDVHPMATSHSPFFADPDGLAELIDRILRS